MKTCSTCGIEKPETEFSWKSKGNGVRQGKCRDCHKAYARLHYEKNSTLYIERAKVSNIAQRALQTQYILRYLSTHPCVDCGETDIEVLEFDHREMVGPHSRRVWSLSSMKRLREEISLCDIRCSNCHTRRTRKQMGWTRLLD